MSHEPWGAHDKHLAVGGRAEHAALPAPQPCARASQGLAHLDQGAECGPLRPPPCSRAANTAGADLSQGQFGSFSYRGPVTDIAIFYTTKAGEYWDTAAPLKLRDSFRPASAVIKLDDTMWNEPWWGSDWVLSKVFRAMGKMPVQGVWKGRGAGWGAIISDTHQRCQSSIESSGLMRLHLFDAPAPCRPSLCQQATRWASPLTCETGCLLSGGRWSGAA